MPIINNRNIYTGPKINWNIDSYEYHPKMEDIAYVYRLESVPLEIIEKYVKIKKSLTYGEKVVCINNVFECNVSNIELNKIFKVYETFFSDDFMPWIRISENSSDNFYPYTNHFIRLKKQRKDKLKKING